MTRNLGRGRGAFARSGRVAGGGGVALMKLLTGAPANADIGTGPTLVDSRGVTMTCTRAGTKLVPNSSGVLVTLATGKVHLNANGLVSEAAITNVCLRSSAMGDAAWTKTNITATSANATGPDGVASSASTLAATGANGTCYQAITTTGTQMLSAWIRRVSGTGTIQITKDGGSTFTTCTTSATWTRFNVLGSTTNPTVGVRIVTSGDSVEVFGAQYENVASMTSNVETAGATSARIIDLNTISDPLNTGTPSWYLEAVVPDVQLSYVGGGRGLLSLSATGATAANTAHLSITSAALAVFSVYDSTNTVSTVTTNAATTDGARIRGVCRSGVLTIEVNGAAVAVTASGAGTGQITTMPALCVLGRAAAFHSQDGVHSFEVGLP